MNPPSTIALSNILATPNKEREIYLTFLLDSSRVTASFYEAADASDGGLSLASTTLSLLAKRDFFRAPLLGWSTLRFTALSILL
jgi:hypothetical protein